jgi:hypothetical protein
MPELTVYNSDTKRAGDSTGDKVGGGLRNSSTYLETMSSSMKYKPSLIHYIQ